MLANQAVEIAIGDLGEAVGLSRLALDEAGRLTLRVDGLPVTLALAEDPAGLLWLWADFGTVPATGVEAPRFLLRLALDAWGIAGLTVGLDADGRRVWATTCLPAEGLDPGSLQRTVEGLVSVGGPIRAHLATGRFEDGNDGLEGEPGTEGRLGMLRA